MENDWSIPELVPFVRSQLVHSSSTTSSLIRIIESIGWGLQSLFKINYSRLEERIPIGSMVSIDLMWSVEKVIRLIGVQMKIACRGEEDYRKGDGRKAWSSEDRCIKEASLLWWVAVKREKCLTYKLDDQQRFSCLQITAQRDVKIEVYLSWTRELSWSCST